MKYDNFVTHFNDMRCMPLFEIELKNNEYLIVKLSIKYKKSKTGNLYPVGLSFDFDNREQIAPYKLLPTYFDGIIKGMNGHYWLSFDECFSLDYHIQMIYDNVITGFIYPNNLQVD